MRILWCVALSAPLTLAAQGIDWSVLDKLAEKAKESAVVNLGPEQLSLVAGVKGKGEAAKLGELARELKSVQVRSFEFEAPGMYDVELVRSLRDKVKASGEWVSIVSVKEKDGFTEILIKKPSGEKTGGLLVIAAEPKEVSIIHVEGVSDLSALGRLGGLAGIPEVAPAGKKAAAPAREKPKEE